MEYSELYHHGVKGMKWGVRKDRSSGGSRRKNKIKGWSKDAKRAEVIKRKSVKQMTNSELRDLNKRVQLEQEYKRLNPNHVKQGLAVVGATAGAMGTVLSLYNNGQNLINIGKKVVGVVRR